MAMLIHIHAFYKTFVFIVKISRACWACPELGRVPVVEYENKCNVCYYTPRGKVM
jgi:hypothetical protein